MRPSACVGAHESSPSHYGTGKAGLAGPVGSSSIGDVAPSAHMGPGVIINGFIRILD